jgi:hypothetical protein
MSWEYSNFIRHVLGELKFHSTCYGNTLILFDIYSEYSNSIRHVLGELLIPFDMSWEYSNSVRHVLGELKSHSTCLRSTLILFDVYWEN